MPKSVRISNPRVLDRIKEELATGAGRGATETTENLILEAAELRRLNRQRNDLGVPNLGEPSA